MNPSMKASIDRVLAEYSPEKNPYFAALCESTSDEAADAFTKDDFVATQIQFYYAVVFFSRPMAVLAAKIPGAEQRTEILRNVWEEHGEADPTRRHGATFLEFLERLAGIRQTDAETYALWPELRAFNTTLIGCCTLDDWEVGCALLGIIERQFADISACIGNAVVARGWLERDQLVHYSLHATLDIKHSDDFFRVLDSMWESGDDARYRIEQGFRLGAYVFDRLYRDMFAARHRRDRSPTKLPQPRVYAE